MNCLAAHTTVEINAIDPLSGGEWDRLILSHPEASFFHGSAWAKVLCTTYGHQPVYLHFVRNGESVALLPMMEVRSRLTGRRGVSLPFTDLCAPLLFDRTAMGLVLDKLSAVAGERKWGYYELRGGQSVGISTKPAVAFHEHTLDLGGDPDLFTSRLKGSVRRAIQKAQRSGLTAEVSRTREAVLGFYRLHVRTRRRHGLPPQPLRFFLNIYEHVIEAGLGFVVLARKDSCLVAAAVFFHLGKKAIYKFGASDERLQEFRGNHLAMWEAIKFLADRGFETLHFGRTSLANDGLRRFKLSWGADEQRLDYFKFDTSAAAWVSVADRTSGFHTALFARLPLAFNRLAGTILYPHLD